MNYGIFLFLDFGRSGFVCSSRIRAEGFRVFASWFSGSDRV